MGQSGSDWIDTRMQYHSILVEFRRGRISLREAESALLSVGEDDQIREFLLNTASEIGGYPDDYDDVVIALESRMSKQEFLEYLNT